MGRAFSEDCRSSANGGCLNINKDHWKQYGINGLGQARRNNRKKEIALTEKQTKKAGHEIHITTNEQLTNMKLNVSL